MIVICKHIFEPGIICLTSGNKYEAELTPTMYDPQTLKRVDPHYIVKCDDGFFRKYPASYFTLLEDYREQVINKILND